MIWLTWRQFRLPAAVLSAGVLALAVALAITGPGVLHEATTNHDGFLAVLVTSAADRALYVLGLLLYAVPPLIGAFWGAPMIARELEAGTHRLVWNQSVTRNRWLAAKLGFGAGTAMLVTGLLSLAVSWWSSPIDRAVSGGASAGIINLPRIAPLLFGARGIVPIGYAALAFVLGVAVGLVLRRSVPAIAVALALMVAVELIMPLAIRPHLISPARVAVPIRADDLDSMLIAGDPGGPGKITTLRVTGKAPGDWNLSEYTIDRAGRRVRPLPAWIENCLPANAPPGLPEAKLPNAQQNSAACYARIAAAGYRQQFSTEPAARFWPLQLRETSLLFALAALLTGFCFWRIPRDLS